MNEEIIKDLNTKLLAFDSPYLIGDKVIATTSNPEDNAFEDWHNTKRLDGALGVVVSVKRFTNTEYNIFSRWEAVIDFGKEFYSETEDEKFTYKHEVPIGLRVESYVEHYTGIKPEGETCFSLTEKEIQVVERAFTQQLEFEF